MGCVASTQKKTAAKSVPAAPVAETKTPKTPKAPVKLAARRNSSFSDPEPSKPVEENKTKVVEKEEAPASPLSESQVEELSKTLVKCVLCKKEVPLSELHGANTSDDAAHFDEVVNAAKSKTRCCKTCMNRILKNAEEEANSILADQKRKQEEENKRKEAEQEKRYRELEKEIKEEERYKKLHRAASRLHEGRNQQAATRRQKGNFRYI